MGLEDGEEGEGEKLKVLVLEGVGVSSIGDGVISCMDGAAEAAVERRRWEGSEDIVRGRPRVAMGRARRVTAEKVVMVLSLIGEV